MIKDLDEAERHYREYADKPNKQGITHEKLDKDFGEMRKSVEFFVGIVKNMKG